MKIASDVRRDARFLTHPGLFKFRPLGRIFSKLGGVLANQENAGVLENGQLVGIPRVW
jgi:hypothetical protein